MGIGLAFMATTRGYKLLLTIPSYTSLEQRVRMQTFGSELVLTDPDKGMGGAIKKAYQILENTRDAFMLQQFKNPANVKAHFETTGPKIWEDTLGQVNIFVMGIGSGGIVWCGQIPQAQESQCQGHGGSHGLLGYVPSLDHVVADTVYHTVTKLYARWVANALLGCLTSRCGVNSRGSDIDFYSIVCPAYTSNFRGDSTCFLSSFTQVPVQWCK